MDETDFISHLAFLKSKTQSAEMTLFLGAGFSMEASDLSGKKLPLGNSLAKELWELHYPDEKFDNSSTLQDVYDLSLNMNSRKTEEFMKRRFSVLKESLPEWYAIFCQFPWKKIYTLNVDNLIQKASEKFESTRPILEITPFHKENVPGSDTFLPLIHLNGSLSDLPDKVTFSKDSYAKRGLFPDHLYDELSAELMTSPFIFIGTTADEPELWKFIELRKLEEKVRGRHEKRPRSFVVMPSINPAKKKLLERFNFNFLPYSGEEFSTLMKTHLISDQVLGLEQVRKRNQKGNKGAREVEFVSDLRVLRDLEVKVDDEFLLGGEPTWQDLQTGKVILREQVSEWVGAIRNQISSTREMVPSETSIFSVLSTAGDGKSTIAKQIALSLDSEGFSIGWIDKESEITSHEIAKVLQSSKRTIDLLIIDDADLLGVALPNILLDLYNNKIIKSALCCLRSSKVDKFLAPELVKPYLFSELTVRKLSENEANQLVSLLDNQNRLGKLKSLTPHERVQEILSRCDSELIVAMIEATSGLKFEAKIEQEYSDLYPDDKDIYCTIACATYFRHYLNKEDLLIMFKNLGGSVAFEILEKMQRRGLVKMNRSDGYTLRHRKVAEIVINSLIRESVITTYFHRIVDLAAVRVRCGTNVKHYQKILKSFLNHNLIFRSSGSEEKGRKFYADLESTLKDDYNFWLQYGCYETDCGSINKARMLLNNANGIRQDHPFTVTALATIDFMQANQAPIEPGMDSLAERALERLEGQIYLSKGIDPYHHHIIGVQGLKWAQRGITVADEKIKYLLKIKTIVQQGQHLHPTDSRLDEVHKEIGRDLMYLKTSK